MFTTKNSFLNMLQPTAIGTVVYLLLSAALLLASSFELIVSFFGSSRESEELILSALQEDFSHSLDLLSNLPLSASLATFLIWLLVGSLLYLAAVGLISFFSEAGFSFIAEWRFMHPSNYHKGGYMRMFILRSALHLAVVVVLIAYTITFVQYLWPRWIDYFADFLARPLTFSGLYSLLFSLAGLVVSIHVITVLLRALFLRTRLFGVQYKTSPMPPI